MHHSRRYYTVASSCVERKDQNGHQVLIRFPGYHQTILSIRLVSEGQTCIEETSINIQKLADSTIRRIYGIDHGIAFPASPLTAQTVETFGKP